ncbi:MAG: hypothetical protein Q7U11_20120 [Phenylobacterium sp.]|uniref:hypothetical protein n=1 Tax=Phenylobacterium sp. TaxID=1871053 RepID=UPI0027203DCE|nr:hypothetical protein [Phenylobacterium sp.]MDO8323263.1 hypothetical protein [Phenylobacterium sp.]MDO9248769.1 hypothetical protein [Phenylobacterium sp.]MDP3633254.1 hypothetical protein [Phenylobacterium sp.]MDP3869821.1 hypothetical protein [Phenylobacterium sp.]MDZ4054442.1 hypothetical protein [Phenylobacterium sp.]
MEAGVTDKTAGARFWLQSIVALLAGFAAVVVLSLLADAVFHLTGVFPATGQAMTEMGDNLLALSYRMVFGAFGSYVAARLAPARPLLHALILGAVGAALAVLGVATTWNMNLGPSWYPIALVVTAMPMAWVGGVLGRKG